MILDDKQLRDMKKCQTAPNCNGCSVQGNICDFDVEHLLDTLEHKQTENDKKEIAYMKQVHELEKEVERLENIEQELTDLKNHYKSKIL